MRNILIRIVIPLWVLLLTALSAYAEVAQPTPMPKTFVHDFAGVITDEKKAEIQAQAQRLKDEFKTEIAVVTIDSLQGEDSFDYSMRMARSWGIGSKDNDIRGLLILVAIKDRKTAFRTSRHIEGEITDGVTGQISRQMNPYFKQGDFGGGLSAGMGMVLERMKEVYEPQTVAAPLPKSNSGLGWLWLPIGLLPVGLGYGILHYRKKQKTDDAQKGQQTSTSGFHDWASTVDPSTVPEEKHKTSSYKKPTPKSPPKKSGHRAGSTYHTGSSDSASSSSGSSWSSSDSSSSSSDDSGSSYSGGSDFGGGGSDSSW
ncbi:MAG TPA: TPM domain-containing protein [Pyrinomonadaceae bacterium]|nr:TPM domain-containing protein [Pyrinomonadaceae bacterium]